MVHDSLTAFRVFVLLMAKHTQGHRLDEKGCGRQRVGAALLQTMVVDSSFIIAEYAGNIHCCGPKC